MSRSGATPSSGIPATGAVTAAQSTGGGFSLAVTRAPEPAVPGWLGTWAYGEPGFEVHATPNACTASPATTHQVGLGLWGATPTGGSLTENLQPVPAGPVCLSVWQFDQGYDFALVRAPPRHRGHARTSTRTPTCRRGSKPATAVTTSN